MPNSSALMPSSENWPVSSITVALRMGAEKPSSLLSSSCGDDSSLKLSGSGAASYNHGAEYEKGSSKVVEKVSKTKKNEKNNNDNPKTLSLFEPPSVSPKPHCLT